MNPAEGLCIQLSSELAERQMNQIDSAGQMDSAVVIGSVNIKNASNFDGDNHTAMLDKKALQRSFASAANAQPLLYRIFPPWRDGSFHVSIKGTHDSLSVKRLHKVVESCPLKDVHGVLVMGRCNNDCRSFLDRRTSKPESSGR